FLFMFIFLFFFFFFFSSRRRNTRLQGDWSSDVCSSDLGRCARPRELLVRVLTLNCATERSVQPGTPLYLRLMPAGGLSTLDKARSEERRVGKECRSRGGREH